MMLGGKPFFGGTIRQLGAIAAGGLASIGQSRRETVAVEQDYVGAACRGERPLTVA